MVENHSTKPNSDDQRINHLMSRYRAGHNDAGDLLVASLEPDLRKVVRGFLGPGDADGDDLVQDALIAMLRYLRKGGILPDNPSVFVATIARNRCRNLYRWRQIRHSIDVEGIENWYASDDHSPLDLLLEGELLSGLQLALNQLDSICSGLLRSLYLEKQSMEQMREQLGLTSVQAVYYRRNQCLGQIKKLFKKTGFDSPEKSKGGINQ